MPRAIAARVSASHAADPALLRTLGPGIAAPPAYAGAGSLAGARTGRRKLPPRLARYTLPDFAAISQAAMDGASLKSLWRDYAASAPAPLRYVAFTRRLKRWKADPQPPAGQTDTAPAAQAAPQLPSRGETPKAPIHRFTPSDMNEIDREIMRGTSIKAEWRKYASAADDPLSYAAFQKHYRQYVAGKRPIAEITPGIPGYIADENAGAERYWADRADYGSAVFVLAGFGCSLKTRHGMLEAFDTGTVKIFEPAGHRLSAIVFGPSGGLISTGAVRWCNEHDISIIVLDYHGNMVSATAAMNADNLKVRRAQFLANPVVMGSAILQQKVAGALRIGRQSEFTYGLAINQIRTANSVERLLQIEANAALDYWSRWRFPMRFKPRGWPASWGEFANRVSGISGSPQHATHPVNAMLNYAYSIVAGLCVRSLFAAGFDPCVGFLHVERQGRYSLAYDLLELLRPEIDNAILPWIASHRWSRADFPVTKSGIVRVHSNLTRVVMQHVASAIAPDRVDRAAGWLAEVVLFSMK